MSESERRRKYRYDRVLIETARVLPSTLADAVVFLSGAQLEMLRNVTQYLRRIETYVTEYNPGYYLAPTSVDYDDILAIVADLEETLMGNPNTIWGYKDTYGDNSSHTKSGAGDKILYYGSVPSGEVWCIEGLTAQNDATVCTKIIFWCAHGSGNLIVSEAVSPAAGERMVWQGKLTLKAGINFWVQFLGCQDGDHLTTKARGYRMAVPE